jgi:hypothetical protein
LNKAAKILAKKRAQQSKKRFVLKDFLFKEQLDFVTDPARFSTAVCSVRAGKTIACAADLINTALELPGSTGLYITLARSSAKRIIWPELKKINEDYKLGGILNEADLSMKFSNRSIIYCMGANNEHEIEKFRGLSNVALAYIDESQAFRNFIKDLVEEILVKRLYDLNGRCRLIGTPGPIPAGYFYDCSKSDKWSHHAWTLHSNIWIQKKSGKTIDELIQQDMDRKGVTVNDPSIQRECFGRWVLDSTSLLLEYNADKNHYNELPIGNYNYILGVDLGFNDSDSLSVLAWANNSPVTYLVEEIVTEKQTIESLVSQIHALSKKYPICKMLIDTGGLGKKIAESLRQRYTIPIEAADKVGKLTNYALLNNALRTGNFKAKVTSIFAQDCSLLEKDRDKSTPDKVIVKGHSDAVDSVLYAFKESPAYSYSPPPKQLSVGSLEWAAAEEERMREALYNHIKEEQDQLKDNPFDEYSSGYDLNKWKR